MELKNRQILKKEIAVANAIKAIGRGFMSMFNKPGHLATMASILVIEFVIWANRDEIIQSIQRKFDLTHKQDLMEMNMQIIMILAIPVALHIFGRPIRGYFMARDFERAGYVNAIGETPMLIDISRAKDNKRARLLEFEIYGLTLSEWKDKQFKIESAINVNGKIKCTVFRH